MAITIDALSDVVAGGTRHRKIEADSVPVDEDDSNIGGLLLKPYLVVGVDLEVT